jgi:hypothetical protein
MPSPVNKIERALMKSVNYCQFLDATDRIFVNHLTVNTGFILKIVIPTPPRLISKPPPFQTFTHQSVARFTVRFRYSHFWH